MNKEKLTTISLAIFFIAAIAFGALGYWASKDTPKPTALEWLKTGSEGER